MNDIDTVNEMIGYSSNVSTLGFIVNVFLVSLLSYLLGLIYIRLGKSISNRAALASSFPLLGLATMGIITVVKSSLALSLGLVGALSIVRFRTPIKEPEELIYLLTCIAIGIGIGADQRIISIILLAGVAVVVYLLSKSNLSKSSKIGAFTAFISFKDPDLKSKIISTLEAFCTSVVLKRLSSACDPPNNDLSLVVTFERYSNMEGLIKELNLLSNEIIVDFVDCSSIPGS